MSKYKENRPVLYTRPKIQSKMKGGESMKRKGFTLIELVVVMAIIAILALMIVGAIILARRASIETNNLNNAKTVQVALEKAYAKGGNYPVLTAGSLSATHLTTLGLTASNMATGGCDSGLGYGVYVTASTASTYTLDVYDGTCTALKYTGSQIKNP